MTIKIDSPIVDYEVVKEPKPVMADTPAPVVRKRPDVLLGTTYKIKPSNGRHSLYVTINNDEHNQPFELFINSKDSKHQQWLTFAALNASALFRSHADIQWWIEEAKQIHDPEGGYFAKLPNAAKGKYMTSVLSHIGHIIEYHVNAYRPMSAAQPAPQEDPKSAPQERQYLPDTCPDCGDQTMVLKDGCPTCDCGYSKCG